MSNQFIEQNLANATSLIGILNEDCKFCGV